MSSYIVLTYANGDRIDSVVPEDYHKMRDLWTVIGRRLASGFDFVSYDFRDRDDNWLTVVADLNDIGGIMSIYEDV